MLQLNPNEILRNNKLIHNSLDIINENIQYLKRKYSNNLHKLEELDINNLSKLTDQISNSTVFLNNIINELTEATGENIDKLLSSNHSLNYFEQQLINHYADNICNDAKKSKLDTIELCYSKDDRLTYLCQKKRFAEYVSHYFQRFKPEEYNLNKETVINDLLDIYDKRGSNEAYAIIHALENNCPQNYHEYHFNPTSPNKSNSYYDFNDKTINNYYTNSETIDVNGYQYEIVQVMPKDYNQTEELAYNFGKANIINTMRTLPNKFLDICSKDNSNTIILTCNKNSMNNNSNWAGYYKPSSFLGKNSNIIAIDIRGSFNDNSFYTQDTLIHEMGHKFDDLLYNKNIFDWLFGTTSYTKSNNNWENAYKKYQNVLNSINLGGYINYPNVNEFFGDAMVAYIKNPNVEKELCPEVYNLINEMLDHEYGYSYQDKIVNILNISN